ncbi:hypothetical protein Tco_1069147 [Tanacetum coccineum]|uniref:Uncharacterized protein n=1 Tax=Tanacetum coccineum TaxID=301880 RepID=A0ABQ5HI55_9ASTR
MVAYLEKSTENADFDEIMDFLNANPIRYALTTTVISESSVRRDLQFNDEDGTVTPLFATMLIQPQADVDEGSGQPTEPQHIPTTALPSNIEPIPIIASSSQPQKTHKHRKTKRPTKISQSSGPTTLVADETVHEERGDSSGPRCQDTILSDIPAQTRFERLSKQSNDPPLSGVNTPGSREDRLKIMELMEICTKLSYRVLALENVKTAQDLEISSLNKRVKKLEKKRLFKVRIESSADKSLGDQEDASKQGRNIAESDQDEEISFVQEDAETQERYNQDIDVTTVSAPITTTGVSMRSKKSKEKAKERGLKENSSKPATKPTRGVTMQEPSESGTRKAVPPSQHDRKDKRKAKMIKPEKPLNKKDQIKFDEEVAKRLVEELEAELEEEEMADYELAQRLQAEEQGELNIKERSRLFIELMDKRNKHFAKLRAEKFRRKLPTKAQKRNQMSTYLRNMARYKHTQLKNKSFKEIQLLFDKEIKRVNSFVPMDSEVVEGSGKKTESSRKETVNKKRAGEELDEESVKRQNLEDDAENVEL